MHIIRDPSLSGVVVNGCQAGTHFIVNILYVIPQVNQPANKEDPKHTSSRSKYLHALE